MMAEAAKEMRILVLEDEFMVALELSHILKGFGVEVVGPTGRAADALKRLERERVDAALLDINLRRGDSLDVARTLLQRNVPFAFVTGYETMSLPEPLDSIPRIVKPAAKERLRDLIEEFGRQPSE